MDKVQVSFRTKPPERPIQAVDSGQAIFSPSLAPPLIDFFVQLQPPALPQALLELTEREHEILSLLVEEQSHPALAKQLALSPKTVSNDVSNLFSQWHVANRAQAMLRARQAGLGEMGIEERQSEGVGRTAEQ